MKKPVSKKRVIQTKASKKRFNQSKEVRAIARERVGTVKPSRVIADKPGAPTARRGAKHKKPPEPDQWDNE